MNIVKWEPFSELTTFRERLGRILDEAAVEAEAQAQAFESDEAAAADGRVREPKP